MKRELSDLLGLERNEKIPDKTAKLIERLKRNINLYKLENKNLVKELQKQTQKNEVLTNKEILLQEIQLYLVRRVKAIKDCYPNEKIVIQELEKLNKLIQESLNYYNLKSDNKEVK